MALIYEVNLSVERAIADDFRAWLIEHVQDMLELPGFTDARILEVLDAPDRIPSGSIRHGSVYNFWQDAKNPKGLWRRTSIADYANPAPKWDILLDVDALAKNEKENWVFEGAECAPKETRCLIRLSRGGGDAVVVREVPAMLGKLDVKGLVRDLADEIAETGNALSLK